MIEIIFGPSRFQGKKPESTVSLEICHSGLGPKDWKCIFCTEYLDVFNAFG